MQGAGEACRRQGIAFLPMAVESFGGWHEVAEREVRKLGPGGRLGGSHWPREKRGIWGSSGGEWGFWSREATQ